MYIYTLCIDVTSLNVHNCSLYFFSSYPGFMISLAISLFNSVNLLKESAFDFSIIQSCFSGFV